MSGAVLAGYLNAGHKRDACGSGGDICVIKGLGLRHRDFTHYHQPLYSRPIKDYDFRQ